MLFFIHFLEILFKCLYIIVNVLYFCSVIGGCFLLHSRDTVNIGEENDRQSRDIVDIGEENDGQSRDIVNIGEENNGQSRDTVNIGNKAQNGDK